MAQFGWDKIDEYHDGYGYVPKEKAQWFRGPEWPDCPSTYEVERHEAKCVKCKKELYLDAAAAVYKCPACETKDAEDGVYGRTDLGEGAIVDWHRAPFLKSDPSLLFSDLNIDVPWKNLVDIVNFPTGPRKLGQPRLVCYMAQPSAMDVNYSYPGLEAPIKPEPMCASVNGIRRRTEERLFGSLDLNYFDSAHINQYRDGDDHVSWHTDEDVELYGEEPIIASVSLHADGWRKGTRDFMLRQGARQIRYKLGSGDLFVTSGTLQKHWEHCLLKNPTTWKTKNEDPRINVTFRRVSRETAPIPLRDWPPLRPAVASEPVAEDMEMD